MSHDSSITHILDLPEEMIAERYRVYTLRFLENGKNEVTRRITQPLLRVGSHPGNDLVIRDDAVSRIHFELTVETGGVRLRDLGSTNGTFVDGFRVYDAHLRSGARIRIGSTAIGFEVLEEESEQLLSEAESFGAVLGRSRPMREMFRQLEQVAPTELTILIQGESGTGKELIAEAIHAKSHAAGGPFVVFDCSAIPANLMESELYGYEKGAFTGADQKKIGCLEEADGGTLFLDEIGELPLELQPKLLRAIEKREVRPIGSTKGQKVEVRVIAASNRDLSSEVNAGAFRADLYYRLAVVTVRVPPLRQRGDDLALLGEALLAGVMPADQSREALLAAFERGVWKELKERPWPGNVRELRNFVEQAAAVGPSGLRRMLGAEREDETDPPVAEKLPYFSSVLDEPTDSLDPRVMDTLPLVLEVDLGKPLLDQKRDAADRFERAYLRGIQGRLPNNLSRAAQKAGLDRSYYKRLLKKHQL